MAEDNFLLCVNAANIKIDYETLLERSQDFDCSVKIFLQILVNLPYKVHFPKNFIKFLDEDLSSLRKMHFIEDGCIPSILARTDYTGEDGFEITAPQKDLMVGFCF